VTLATLTDSAARCRRVRAKLGPYRPAWLARWPVSGRTTGRLRKSAVAGSRRMGHGAYKAHGACRAHGVHGSTEHTKDMEYMEAWSTPSTRSARQHGIAGGPITRSRRKHTLIVVMKETLASLFKPYRPLLPITAHRNVRMRGQAFVTFSDRENANAARREVNEFPLYGKAMVGCWFLLGSGFISLVSLDHGIPPSSASSFSVPFFSRSLPSHSFVSVSQFAPSRSLSLASSLSLACLSTPST